MRILFILLLAALLISTHTQSQIRNKITIKSNGIKVKQAFLLFDDSGKLVPEGNKIEVNQQVNLRLIIEGWKPVNGKVFLGSAEKITTDEGDVILDEKDLFADYIETGFDAKDAKVITLSATITSIEELFKYFLVTFKVWDRKSSAYVTGSYRLYLK